MKSLVDALQPIQKLNIIRNILPEDGPFPNNTLLPVLLYREAFNLDEKEDEDVVKEILETNGWSNAWVDTILSDHHFHSNTHEVLVALRGSTRVQFGGPNGISLTFEKGDVVIIPAGVAHKKVDEGNDFQCLGAYPDGKDYDMNYGKPEDRPRVDENIRKVDLPKGDPLYGSDGPLIKNWHSASHHPENTSL